MKFVSIRSGPSLGDRPFYFAFLFGILLFLFLFLRRPDSLTSAQFWAEDGTIFYADQISMSFWSLVGRPYFGYLHVIPRVICLLSTGFPVRWAPTVISISTLLLAALCCSAFAWTCFRPIVSSDALRICCCLLVATATSPGSELIATVSNVQWFLSPLFLLLVLLDTPQGKHAWRREAVVCCAQVLIALSSPQTVIAAPLLLWQAVRQRGWQRARPLLAMAAIGVQVWEVKNAHLPAAFRPNLNFNAVFLTTLDGGISRCVLSPLIGHTYLTRQSPLTILVEIVLALMISAVLLTVLFLRIRPWQRRRVLLAAVYLGTASVAIPMAGRNLAAPFLTLDGLLHSGGERYFFLASCLFIFVMTFSLDTVVSRIRGPWGTRIACLCFIAAFGLGIRNNYEVPAFSDFRWPDQAGQIQKWLQSQKRSGHAEAIVIPINPSPWTMRLEPRR